MTPLDIMLLIGYGLIIYTARNAPSWALVMYNRVTVAANTNRRRDNRMDEIQEKYDDEAL